MEFLSEVSVVQWCFLGLGAGLIAPSVWDVVNSWNDKRPKPSPRSGTDLTKIVRQWQTLTESCEEVGLDEACKRLEEVFPLLISAREKEATNDE